MVSDYGGFECYCIVSDGATSMIGIDTGFAGLLKQTNINCPVIHCFVHLETFCVKSLRLIKVMKAVVKITDIRTCFFTLIFVG